MPPTEISLFNEQRALASPTASLTRGTLSRGAAKLAGA